MSSRMCGGIALILCSSPFFVVPIRQRSEPGVFGSSSMGYRSRDRDDRAIRIEVLTPKFRHFAESRSAPTGQEH